MNSDRNLRRAGLALNVALVTFLLVSILARANWPGLSSLGDWLVFVALILWAALPYGIMAFAHRYLLGFDPAVLLVGSVLIAVFGAYFLIEAFWLNFAPTAAGLPLAFMPLYQLPGCAVAILAAKLWHPIRA